MAAAVPTWVKKKALQTDDTYGSTIKRFVDIYLEVSCNLADTTDLATYVPGLAGIQVVDGSSQLGVSYPTFSGTTLTYKQQGNASHKVLGYY